MSGRGRAGAWLAVIAVCAAPAAASAQGGYDTAPTREQWVAQANDLCRESNKKTVPLAKKLNKLGRQGKAVKFGRTVRTLARLLDRLLGGISALDRPPADRETIQRWIVLNLRANDVASGAGTLFIDGEIERGNRFMKRAAKLSARAEKLVVGFGLKQC